MTTTDPRVQAALDAAANLIRTTVASAGARAVEAIDQIVQNATRPQEREDHYQVLQELRRNLGTFQGVFHEALREKVAKEVAPAPDAKRKLESASWETLSLVEDKEVEERMAYVRIGQLISHECEWQLRDLAAYMGSLLELGRADDDRNPLRPEVIGAALNRGIEAISSDRDRRQVLVREIGLATAKAMPACYENIIGMLQTRGVKPVHLTVRQVEGPGNQIYGVNSGYASLARDGRISTRGSGYGDYDDSSRGDLDLLAAHRRALASAFPPGRPAGDSGQGALPPAASPPPRVAGAPPRGRADAAADQQLMTLLRRLTSVASRPGALEPAHLLGGGAPSSRGGVSFSDAPVGYATRPAAPVRSGPPEPTTSSGRPALGTDSSRNAAGLGQPYGDGLTGLMAVNLIRAHREELVNASSGKLDHMVIDVVGSLFDQILSDSRVPPQMAREIARLQLPVLRVALNDSTFFSTRRHPVRRFINRIASLANAFDDFREGPGAEFLGRVRKLVGDIVEGDFDQVDLYVAKLADLESFIEQQTEEQVEQIGAVKTLETKESELRMQQRYMLQLRSSLAPSSLPPYLNDFLAQVWSQALVLAVRRDGQDSDRARRYRRVGTELVMSIQPKGSPQLRKKFLMQLPALMRDLNEGMQLIGWPEAAQKEFFGQLLPAHAESLKGTPMSELDFNLMAKKLEAVFAVPVPTGEQVVRGAGGETAEVESEVIEKRFSPEEAERIGLVPEAAVDWSHDVAEAGAVDIDIGDPPAATPGVAALAPAEAAEAAEMVGETESQLGSGPSSGSGTPGEAIKGPQLIDHIRVGFAYQMHLKDEWQKVRLAHVSSGRTFFVFTRGGKHQETISMTSRMLARMCETGRLRAVESAYLMERATVRARKQLAELKAQPTRH